MKNKQSLELSDPQRKTDGRTKNSSFFILHSSFYSKGFTLVEMLVVIGIIAVLIGASVAGYSKMTKSAEKAKVQELVRDTATALTALFQTEGNWPKRLATAASSGDGQLDENAALPLARGKYMSLTTTGSGQSMRLAGLDRFGVVTPWATAVIKRRGTSAAVSDKIFGSATVKDHILHFAIDSDGDGIVEANVGGQTVKIRATAAVWCCGKDGVISPYPYASGGSGSGRGGENKGAGSSGRLDNIYSWSIGQTKEVQ